MTKNPGFRSDTKYGSRGGYVVMEGERIDIRARMHVLSGYSAHADQRELIDWVGKLAQPPGRIKLVHGDEDARQALAAAMSRLGYVMTTDGVRDSDVRGGV